MAVVMGRHADFLTAASALGKKFHVDAPHLIYLLAKDLEHDAHGNLQLSGYGALADQLCEDIKNRLKIKRVRGDTFGDLQRSFIGCV